MHNKMERRCIACHSNFQQDVMLRIAKINGEYVLDINQKLGGRGAYVCKNSNCINITLKKKLLNRSFKCNVDASIYQKLGDYEQNN